MRTQRDLNSHCQSRGREDVLRVEDKIPERGHDGPKYLPGNRGPTAIITGPPWPRSGTGRVLQNQIEYYRERGYFTVFICVPIHCSFTADHVDWPTIRSGLEELGADRLMIAVIDRKSFVVEKYKTWLTNGFRGTALDWIVFTAKTASLSHEDLQFVQRSMVEVVHVNHVFTLDFARKLLKEIARSERQGSLILDTHDIQARALEERGEINPWTHQRDSFDRMFNAEIAHLKKAEVLVHLSIEDLNCFKRYLPQKSHVLAMPTIDERFVEAGGEEPKTERTDILFVGQSTPPNIAALRWFLEAVWPLIQDCNYSLRIVGGIEIQARVQLPELYEKFRSCFVGLVPELAPAYRGARCVIAPMISGTGISIKTIEALAFGKPFVGTSKAYRGMPMDLLHEAGLRAHDAPQEFADAIAEALSDESKAARRSSAAYSRLFSKQASFSSRDVALRLALGDRAVSPEAISKSFPVAQD